MSSLEETLAKNTTIINRKKETIAEAMSWSESGQLVSGASVAFAKTRELQNVMYALSDAKATEIDKFKISQYFAQALEGDPSVNLSRFAEYLESISRSTDDKNRSKYYRNVKEAILVLKDSDALKLYMSAYNKFLSDKSEEAVIARKVIRIVSNSMKQIFAEYV